LGSFFDDTYKSISHGEMIKSSMSRSPKFLALEMEFEVVFDMDEDLAGGKACQRTSFYIFAV
jgi:hypothetical protein